MQQKQDQETTKNAREIHTQHTKSAANGRGNEIKEQKSSNFKQSEKWTTPYPTQKETIMKNWNTFREDIANTASGGSIAGLGSPPDDEPVVRKKKKKLDGRTKEFKEKVKSLESARKKRLNKAFERKYGIKLR